MCIRDRAYAAYADLVWCETGKPDLEFARKFAEGVHAKYPGKMLEMCIRDRSSVEYVILVGKIRSQRH